VDVFILPLFKHSLNIIAAPLPTGQPLYSPVHKQKIGEVSSESNLKYKVNHDFVPLIILIFKYVNEYFHFLKGNKIRKRASPTGELRVRFL